MTVGDGRFGTDGNALMRLGAENVYCSDISDKLLKIGNEKGFIKEFSAENAEKLSFQTGKFDFVLCKEAYHHFPRPHIALHEMMRVCKVGIILMEPNDEYSERPPLKFIINIIKRILGRKKSLQGHSFETVGNYVFSISKRELEKIQLGMHRRFIAFNSINDHYENGFEFIDMNTENKKEKFIIKKTLLRISIRNFLCRWGFLSPGTLVSILFKDEPNKNLLASLRKSGWDVRELPKNPYL